MGRRSSRVHPPTCQSQSPPEPRPLAPSRHRYPHRKMVGLPCSCRFHRPCSKLVMRGHVLPQQRGWLPPTTQRNPRPHATWARCVQPNPSPLLRSMAWIWLPPPSSPGDWPVKQSFRCLETDQYNSPKPRPCGKKERGKKKIKVAKRPRNTNPPVLQNVFVGMMRPYRLLEVVLQIRTFCASDRRQRNQFCATLRGRTLNVIPWSVVIVEGGWVWHFLLHST